MEPVIGTGHRRFEARLEKLFDLKLNAKPTV